MSYKPWTARVMLRVAASSKEDIEAAVSYYTSGEWKVLSGPKRDACTRKWVTVLIHVGPESSKEKENQINEN